MFIYVFLNLTECIAYENRIIASIDPTVTFNRYNFKLTYKLRSIRPINSIFDLKNKK